MCNNEYIESLLFNYYKRFLSFDCCILYSSDDSEEFFLWQKYYLSKEDKDMARKVNEKKVSIVNVIESTGDPIPVTGTT